MSDLAKCLGCGATNRLPEGKGFMNCTYCGAGVERQSQPQDLKKDESLIKIKPEIINGDLVLRNRKLKSISELIAWYSDSEINTVKCLDLSENEITSLKGLSSFKNANRIYLDENRISMSDEDVSELTSFDMNGNSGVSISLLNNTFTSLDWVEKVNFDTILNTYHEITIGDQYYEYVEFSIQAGNGELFFNKTYHHQKSSKRNPSTKRQSTPNSFQLFFGRLSILDWAALIAPYIFAIVIFKSTNDDKTSTIGFLDFLVVFLAIVVIIRFYPFFSKKVKTGRSFESQYGKVEEYTTVEGKVNTEHGWWIVSLIHIVVIVLILKIHGFGTSKIESDATRVDNTESNPSITAPRQENSSPTAQSSAQPMIISSAPEQKANESHSAISTEPQSIPADSITLNIHSGSATAISDRAFFYDEPTVQTIRKAYIVKGQTVDFTDDQNGFIKASFINAQGMKTSGWMLDSDFKINNQK